MNHILIRVTKDACLKADVLLEYLKNEKHQVFGCEEHPRDVNPHYHFWMRTDLRHDTVQKFIRDNCWEDTVVKKGRLFSVKSQEGKLKYLCKGPLAISKLKEKDFPGKQVPPVISINTAGFSAAEIKQAHDEWWDEATGYASRKKKGEKVSVENQKKVSWFETLIEDCKDRGINHSSDGWQLAASIVRSYTIRLKCEPNDFQIKSYAKSIQAQLYYELQQKSGVKIYDRYVEARAKQIIGSEWVAVTLSAAEEKKVAKIKSLGVDKHQHTLDDFIDHDAE